MEEKNKRDLMEDPDDLGLRAVMGKHFQDKIQESAPDPKGEKKAEPTKVSTEKKACQNVMDAALVPVKAETTEIHRLVNCAKHTVLYGGISGLLFWWQQAGLLASEAAVPSFIVLALLAGLKIGSCMAAKEG